MSVVFFRDIFCLRRERSMAFAAIVAAAFPWIIARFPLVGLYLSVIPAYYVSGWACGLEYKYKTDRFLCALPVPRLSLVAGRYASAAAAWLASCAIAFPIWTLLAFLGVGRPLPDFLFAAIVSGSMTLVFHAVFFGAYYLLGYQNARWAIFVVFMLFGSMAGILGGDPVLKGKADAAEALLTGTLPPVLYASLVGFGVLLYAVSFAAASFAYGRREF